MQEPRPIVSHAIHSSQALFRFVLRLVLLCAFASLSTRGFGTALASLLALSAIFCVSSLQSAASRCLVPC